MERTLILLNGKKYEGAVGVLCMTSFKMAAILVAILDFTQMTVTRTQAFRTHEKWQCKIEKKGWLINLSYSSIIFHLIWVSGICSLTGTPYITCTSWHTPESIW